MPQKCLCLKVAIWHVPSVQAKLAKLRRELLDPGASGGGGGGKGEGMLHCSRALSDSTVTS